MLDSWRQIDIVVLTDLSRLIAVRQDTGSFQDEVHLFLSRIAHPDTASGRVNGHLTETGNSLDDARIRIAGSKDRFVMARLRTYVDHLLGNVRNKAAQESGIHPVFLAKDRRT